MNQEQTLIGSSAAVFCCLMICSAAFGASPCLDHEDLSHYVELDGTRAPIRMPADWQKRRAQIIAGMEEVMGPLPRPGSPVPLDVRVLEEHKEDGYVRRKIAYHTDNAKQVVHAWLLLPRALGIPQETGRGEGALYRHPAMLCLHQTTPNGKDSPVGLADRPSLHYALELTKRGYVTLSPDYPSFGESKDYDFDADNYASGTMKAIYDNTRAIDLLQSLPEVDPNRIGVIGHSLGGHNALFTAVFEPRIRAVVTSCGFTSFHKYKGGDLSGWTSPRYMPLIASKYHHSPDEMPFDFAEVIAAIAPQSVFINAPLHDDNFDVEGVRECVDAARPIYKLLGHPDRLQVVHPDCGHDFPDAARERCYAYLDRVLMKASGHRAADKSFAP
ncbi:MAG TPA: alpha/beta fold hydrolase [Lacipirellulaceae bacterium]|nr:alpha/beta fold hydrolase [Lacipirellulaceae bacterium]